MRHLNFILVIVALTITVGAHGQPADVPPSRINAFLCGTLPAPLQLDVQVLDNSRRIIAFRDQFEKELQARGVSVSRTAATIVILDFKTVREFQGKPKDAIFERPSDRNITGVGQEGAVPLQGNVWSNKEGSLFGGPKGESDTFSLNQLQVSASINSRTGGHCLWQGEVLHDLHGDEDPDNLTRKILPVLAQAIGKTIRNRALNLNL